MVTKRSTQLIGAAIVGILRHIANHRQRKEDTTQADNIVAVDGGVLADYSLYRDLLCNAVRDIAGEEFSKTFQLSRIEGGAGFGVAVLAAASYNFDNSKKDEDLPLAKRKSAESVT